MYKDNNKPVMKLKDSYFCLEEDKREILQHYIQNTINKGTITSLQIQKNIQEDTGILFTQDDIKYVMLLNNYIPKDMHSEIWQFSI